MVKKHDIRVDQSFAVQQHLARSNIATAEVSRHSAVAGLLCEWVLSIKHALDNVKETNNNFYQRLKLNSYSEYISIGFCEQMLSKSEKNIFSIILRNYGEEKYINTIVLQLICKTIQGLNYIFENKKNIDADNFLENIEDNLISGSEICGIEIDIVDKKITNFKTDGHE